MKCPRETLCFDTTTSYDQMCDVIDAAKTHEQTARDMMASDMVAGVTEAMQGHEPSALQREVRSQAFDAAAQLAEAEKRKTAFEQELLNSLPLLEPAFCPSCPLAALGTALALRDQL